METYQVVLLTVSLVSRAVIDDSKNATQSPYALYLDWRIMSGVADNLPSDDDSID